MLQVGCGSGALADSLQRLVRFDGAPVGVDVSRRLLADGGALAERVQASGAALPFGREVFDLVLLGHVVSQLDDDTLALTLREARRVLVPGGVCLLWDYRPSGVRALERLNRWVIGVAAPGRPRMRSTWQLVTAASEAAFGSIRVMNWGPFYWPPIPRTTLLLRKRDSSRSPRHQV